MRGRVCGRREGGVENSPSLVLARQNLNWEPVQEIALKTFVLKVGESRAILLIGQKYPWRTRSGRQRLRKKRTTCPLPTNPFPFYFLLRCCTGKKIKDKAKDTTKGRTEEPSTQCTFYPFFFPDFCFSSSLVSLLFLLLLNRQRNVQFRVLFRLGKLG